MTLAEVARVTGGQLTSAADPSVTITGSVEHDSRKVTPGGLFVAIKGERVDGHDYVSSVIEAGAVAALVSQPVDVPAIIVDDVLIALGKLARAAIDKHPNLTVIGITGSSGKTSTKDIIAVLCSRLGETIATEGNFNNELGHPYTVCRVTESTRYLVLEMGARGTGHLDYLMTVAPVDIGVVLNVGSAHLEGFGSIEAIATAKGELAAGVNADGTVILNADDPRVSAMNSRTDSDIVYFGMSEKAAVTARDLVLDAGRPRYQLTVGDDTAPVELELVGEHQVSNTLAAAAVATELGMTVTDCAVGLSTYNPVSVRRMDVHTRSDGITVIDDSYNANPSSMTAALHALSNLGTGRRKVAVLGYMAEIGETSDSAHEEIGRLAGRLGVELLIVVEELAHRIAVGARATGVTTVVVENQQQACDMLDELVHPQDVILVKGSRYRTWQVADHLKTPTHTEEADA